MTDKDKTKKQLLKELVEIRQECLRLKSFQEKDNVGFNSQGDQLRSANGKLLDVLEWSQIGLWEWDKETDSVFWSDKLYQIAGLDSSRPAPSYAEHSNIYTPQSWGLLKTAVENTLITGDPYRLELEMNKPDGTLRNLSVYGGAKYDETEKKIIGLFGLVQDETERKLAEMALRESEFNFEKVVNTMMESFSIITKNGDFIYVNAHAAKNISGEKPDAVIGKNIRDFVPPAQANKLIEAYHKVISTKQSVQEEMKITLTGSDKWFISTLQFIQWGPEKLPAVLSISLNITDSKQKENDLRLSEERNRLLSSVTMEGILIHKNGIAKDLNQSLAKMLGYKYEELLNKDFFEIVHVDDHAKARENISKEYASPYEVRAIRKNGELINIEVESKNFQYKDEKWRVSAFRDITARKQSEGVMRTMAEMLNLAPSSITVHDTAGRFLFANQKTFELHGYTESEFLAINLHSLDVPESEAMLSERFRLIEESGYATFEVAHFHKDGHKIPMEVFARKVEWRGQHAVLSIATDITESKQAKEEIIKARKQAEASEARFRNYIQNSPTSVFLVDQKGRYTFVNNSACNLLGYSESELLQMSIQDLLVSGLPNDENGDFRELKQTEVIHNVEKKLIRKDGQVIDVVLDGKKLSENEYIAFVKDITERKQTEAALQKSEERFALVVDASEQGIWDWNVETNEIYYSPQWKNQIGYSDHEIKNEFDTWIEHLHPDEKETCLNAVQSYLNHPTEHFILEFRFRHKDGSYRWIHNKSSSLKNNSGKVIRMFGMHTDITEQKNAELLINEKNKKIEAQNEEYAKLNEDLIQTNKQLNDAKEKAEESDRLKTAFLANMSHEIRTPMNGILGFAELLKEPSLTVDEQQDFIQTIGISGARMLNTINNIIDVSKIESGMIKVNINETNLNAKTEFIYKFFKPEVENKGLQFIYKNRLPAKEVIINTDNEKVYAILTNLIKNAIKFTYDGSIEFGYVIKPGCEPYSIEQSRSAELEFFVKDTGTGIPENQKKLIFERFRQGSDSLTRNYEGSGLGLSICKSYVEMLGGKMWVESEEGKGSIFYFTLPYNPVSVENHLIENVVFAENKEVQLKNLKILIVEDDEISYSLLIRTVRKISKEVLHATTGIEAVEFCRNNPDIDLVLMDIRMPQMNGLEATQRIRQFNPDVIIIAQTAYGFTSDRGMALEAGCNDYISKPIDKNGLFSLIKKHL